MSENKNDRNENTAGHSDVRKLPPTDPEARDEGPRLIPLAERRHDDIPVAFNRRYQDLADRAIRRKPPASQSSPRATKRRNSR